MELTEVTPQPDQQSDQAVTWVGSETTFTIGQPRVTVTETSTNSGIWILGAVGLGGVLLIIWYLRRIKDGNKTTANRRRDGVDGSKDQSGDYRHA